jgi:hypothetical protein
MPKEIIRNYKKGEFDKGNYNYKSLCKNEIWQYMVKLWKFSWQKCNHKIGHCVVLMNHDFSIY